MCARRVTATVPRHPLPRRNRRPWFAACGAAYSFPAATRAWSLAATLAPTANALSDERQYAAAPGDSAIRAATAAVDDHRIRQADSMDRWFVSRGLRRAASRYRPVSRPSCGWHRRAQRVRYRRGPVLLVWHPDLLVGAARHGGPAAARLVAVALD